MNSRLFAILFILLSLSFFEASASHIVGGEFTYKYLGDTLIGGGVVYHKYQVSLAIYEDCYNGQPEAIAQDNPAYLAAYNNAYPYNTVNIDSVSYATSVAVPANFSNACVSNIPPTCLLKKTFIKTYYFPNNAAGYVISYQRCCRNNAVVNIQSPGDNGCTYYCTIPGSPYTNNSAVFRNYPPQIICLNNPLYYDHSATDADGDSLSYEFCNAFIGASDADIKPIPLPPPYQPVLYVPPYSSLQPMTAFPPIQIDPVTGLITGTPNRIGRYLVTVCCHEWRHGVLINTSKREFQFVVTDCSKVVVADIPQYSTDFNTYIVDCLDYTVHFVNTSKGGFSWHWNFGVMGSTNDTSAEFEPTFTYPDTGTFAVKLVVNPGSTCPDSIIRLVKIYPKFHAAFSDSGMQCPGAPINFTDLSSASIKPITYWKWYFGDGDTILEQNPVHSYAQGGTYNVILISQNIKNCIDTALRKLIIEGFRPFAGNDTIIVKGEHILFDAMGGTSYTWSPGTNLSDTTIFDPVGYYPDTGHFAYNVHVVSDYGCSGDDSIKVEVVNQAAFFVPSAFTPNGDGLNDIFKPIAIGYRDLKFFRVFNRFGEMVYNGNTLEVGWDGTYNHKHCDVGVYFWEVRFTDRFGKEGFLKGDVTLIR
ncbi:MAG: PKD domain-containing protein [Chitinophagales bacterium]